MIQFTIPVPPITKKNSQQILVNRATGRPFISPSKAYKQYLKDCGHFIRKPKTPINYAVNVKALFYMRTRRKVDKTNLEEALHDILVHYGVLEDDNSTIIYSTDGTRVFYDKENPRTEITITEIQEVS